MDWDLHQLHLTIQAAFNWWNYHLHEFHIGERRYGVIAVPGAGIFTPDPTIFDERKIHLRDFAGVGTRFSYIYDFGDDWQHTIELEVLLSLDAALPSTQRASMVPVPGRPKTSAAFQVMSSSWRSSTTPKILNTPKPRTGAVDISIRSGSTFQPSTRTFGTP